MCIVQTTHGDKRLAVFASRSSLVCALLRSADPNARPLVRSFLQGLSLDELCCLAEFQGACVLESLVTAPSPYRVLPYFFDPEGSHRWQHADDRAQKTFIVLEWLAQTSRKPVALSLASVAVQAA